MVRCFKALHGNFLNSTNNRLESVNSKLKSVIKKYSSFEDYNKGLAKICTDVKISLPVLNGKGKEQLKSKEEVSSLLSYVNSHIDEFNFYALRHGRDVIVARVSNKKRYLPILHPLRQKSQSR